MYRSKFIKASKTFRHFFQQLRNLTLVATLSLQNMQLDDLSPIDFVESVQRHNRTENSQPSKRMEHSNWVAAKWVNLSMPFEGHRMQQAQYRSFKIYQACFFLVSLVRENDR